jgi:hypothetical protein
MNRTPIFGERYLVSDLVSDLMSEWVRDEVTHRDTSYLKIKILKFVSSVNICCKFYQNQYINEWARKN